METPEKTEAATYPDAELEEARRNFLPKISLILALGWAVTNIAYGIADLPFQFLLKEQLKLPPEKIARFMFWAVFFNYIKPLAGILTDSVPLFGTRRRAYLLYSLLLCGLGWIALSAMPLEYSPLLATYMIMYLMVVFISTTLGGVMVEVGTRFGVAGRLTAQRIGMFKVGALLGSPIGGYLAQNVSFFFTTWLVAGLHFALIPLVFIGIREPRTAKFKGDVWKDAGQQLTDMVHNRTLLVAALMIVLIAIAPGFGTPLLFHQTDTLKFDKQFIGNLGMVHAAFGLMAAWMYRHACTRYSLKTLIAGSIIIHAIGTLFYLAYGSRSSAISITALEGITQTLAMLPVYDLAVRATPRGSEALGYSVMMSAWNLTNGLSNWLGSAIYQRFHLTFHELVWINAGSTLIALVAIPLLPKMLLQQRDAK
jgi:predicted MFS family arabinose efflux permease